MIYRPKPNKIGPSRSDARLLDDVENAGKHHEHFGIYVTSGRQITLGIKTAKVRIARVDSEPIPRPQANAAVEQRLRQFLKGKTRMGASSGLTLAKFSEWLDSLRVQGQTGFLQECGQAPLIATFDAIKYLADKMIRGGTT